MALKIITAMATKNRCYLKAQKMTPKGIVVHSTGANNPNLKRYVDAPDEVGYNPYGNHWNNANVGVCVHGFVGYDKNKQVRVANILPYNYCCWGVGAGRNGSYNYNPAYIQFEMCEDDLTNEQYFEQVRDTAIEYCVQLCKQFGIQPDKIVSHKEAHAQGYGDNHGDPNNWWDRYGYTMDKFRAAVKAKLQEQEKPKQPKEPEKPKEEAEVEKIYNTVQECPAWAQEAVQALVNGGYLNGTAEGKLNLSEELLRTLVILYRVLHAKGLL